MKGAVKQCLELSGPALTMPTDQLLEEFAPILERTYRMRPTLRTLVQNVYEYPLDDETRSLRGFWYRYIKPTVSRLGLFVDRRPKVKYGPTTEWNHGLSSVIDEMRKDGLVTYASLNIRDNSRSVWTQREPMAPLWVDISAGVAERGAVYPEIVLAIEKDSEYETVSAIARMFGCSSYSCGGQSAVSAVEYLATSIERATSRPIRLLVLSDFDPAGFSIAEALAAQFRSCVTNEVILDRLGMWADTLPPDRIENSTYELTPGNPGQRTQMYEWLSSNSGSWSREEGIELDALNRNEIRKLYIDALRELVDPDAILNVEGAKREPVAELLRREIKDVVLGVVREIADRYDEDIEEMERPDLFEEALEGYSRLPQRSFAVGREDEIAAAAVQLLAARLNGGVA